MKLNRRLSTSHRLLSATGVKGVSVVEDVVRPGSHIPTLNTLTHRLRRLAFVFGNSNYHHNARSCGLVWWSSENDRSTRVHQDGR